MSALSAHPANSGARLSTKASAIAVSVVGGAMYGISAGIIGGVQTAIVQGEYFPQDDKSRRSILSGVLVACLLLGAFIGCFVAVWLGNKRGMRFSFRVAAINCILMSVLMAVVPGFELLVLFRTLLGLSIGFACALVPWYVTDAIPASTRGSIGTIFQIGICGFILLSQIINYVAHPDADDEHVVIASWNWRTQVSLSVVPGVFMLILSFIMHESPVFLQSLTEKERLFIGEGSMSPHAHGNLPNDVGMNYLPSDEPGNAPAAKEPAAGWGELFTRSNIKWVAVALILSSSQQLTGINAIIFYAPGIFTDAGMSHPLVLTFSVVGTWNLLSVFISFALVDRLGRRVLMLGALALMGVGAGLMALAYQAFPEHKGPVAIVSLLLFVGAFECGPGPLFFLMAVESFPPRIRDAALSLTQSSAWVFSIMVTFGFPVINDSLGSAATFLIFTILCVISLLLIWLAVPEPQGTGAAAVEANEKDALASVQAGNYGSDYQKL